jgi:hypothetical protein
MTPLHLSSLQAYVGTMSAYCKCLHASPFLDDHLALSAHSLEHCFIMWIMWEGMLPLESALLSWYEIYDFSEYTENKSTNHPFHVILQVGVCI